MGFLAGIGCEAEGLDIPIGVLVHGSDGSSSWHTVDPFPADELTLPFGDYELCFGTEGVASPSDYPLLATEAGPLFTPCIRVTVDEPVEPARTLEFNAFVSGLYACDLTERPWSPDGRTVPSGPGRDSEHLGLLTFWSRPDTATLHVDPQLGFVPDDAWLEVCGTTVQLAWDAPPEISNTWGWTAYDGNHVSQDGLEVTFVLPYEGRAMELACSSIAVGGR